MCAHSLLFFDASAETGTKHAAPTADRRAVAGSVIVGRLRPEIYATSWFHFAYLVDPFRNYQWLLVTSRSGPIMLDSQGRLSIAALSLY